MCAKCACVGATSQPQTHDLEAILRLGDSCFFLVQFFGGLVCHFVYQKIIRFSAPETTGKPLQEVKIKVSKGLVL